MKSGIKPLTMTELGNCKYALSDVLGGKPGEVMDPRIKDAVIAVFAAYYRTRMGVAVGSIAVKARTGQCAIRYFDEDAKALRWLVYESPERKEGLYGERMDDLPANGQGWVINERDWKELVFT